MEVTFFTYLGVFTAAYLFAFPVMDFVDWGKKPWRKRR